MQLVLAQVDLIVRRNGRRCCRRSRIQSGFAGARRRTILIGMRAVFSAALLWRLPWPACPGQVGDVQLSQQVLPRIARRPSSVARDVQVPGLDDGLWVRPTIAAGLIPRMGERSISTLRKRRGRNSRFSDAQAEGGDLGVADIDAGAPSRRSAVDAMFGEQIDDRLLDGGHQFAHLDFQAGRSSSR